MQLYFLGQLFSVATFNTSIKSYMLSFNYSEFVLTTPVTGGKKDKIDKVIENWYRKQARTIIVEQVNKYCKLLGVNFNRLVIKDTKTRWGSCSSKGNLNFNYNLIKMPKQILEYVVIHEVCHLKYLNHSKEYWNLVGKICPEYKDRIRWVKQNGLRFIK